MSDRLVSSNYYEQQLQHQSNALLTSNLIASKHQAMHFQRLHEYRSGSESYDGRSFYNSNYAQAYASNFSPYRTTASYNSSSNYLSDYYTSAGTGAAPGMPYETGYGARTRFSPYHYQSYHHCAQQQGMLTPAGQQLVPSSVLHYPPRNNPYIHSHSQHNAYEQQTLYTRTSYLHHSLNSYAQTSHHLQHLTNTPLTSNRSSTPAPNRTVVPHYLEPLHNYHGSFARRPFSAEPNLNQINTHKTPYASNSQLPIKPIDVAADGDSNLATSPNEQRYTTSPPLISATGTDSGISNCSTRARSNSRQSTPVFNSEYPVSMSVESSSCVSYHCLTDGNELEEYVAKDQVDNVNDNDDDDSKEIALKIKQEQPDELAEPAEPAEPAESPVNEINDISISSENANQRGSRANGKHEKCAPESDDDTNCEIDFKTCNTQAANTSNTSKPVQTTAVREAALTAASNSTELKPATSTTSITSITPTNAHCATPIGLTKSQRQNSNWSPIPSSPNNWSACFSPSPSPSYSSNVNGVKRPYTPPVPHNSPVDFGVAAMLDAPRNRTTVKNSAIALAATNKNRIIECDLIPNKKNKRKSSNSSSTDTQDADVREEIRNIKPLPGFQQAFGSTEIGRFSEIFLLTPENSLESITRSDEYIAEAQVQPQYQHQHQQQQQHQQHQLQQEPPPLHYNTMHTGWSSSYNTMQDFHRRFGAHSFKLQHSIAYERYCTRTSHARSSEIRCNGY